MELLEREILKKGKVLPGDVLKVGAFLNNQIDIPLMSKLADNVAEHFADKGINKILTVEASGIAFATLIGEKLGANVVFAKKSKTLNVDSETYTAKCYSYTHQTENTLIVPKEFLHNTDKVLLADDFLARGEAVGALMKITGSAGAELKGVAIAIEKSFFGFGDKLRASGVDLLSLAIVDKMEDGKIVFRR